MCSECQSEWVCRVGGVVPPCTLEQWVDSPPPNPTGGKCRVWWDHTILHSRAVGLFYHPPAHRGQIRHYDITRNLSNSAGEYAVWMHVSACRCPMGSHHSTLSSSERIISPPRHTGRFFIFYVGHKWSFVRSNNCSSVKIKVFTDSEFSFEEMKHPVPLFLSFAFRLSRFYILWLIPNVVQSCTLLNWRNIRVFFSAAPVPVN